MYANNNNALFMPLDPNSDSVLKDFPCNPAALRIEDTYKYVYTYIYTTYIYIYLFYPTIRT